MVLFHLDDTLRLCLEFAAKLCDSGSRRIVEAVIVVRERKGRIIAVA
jgi:hypothetical protein